MATVRCASSRSLRPKFSDVMSMSDVPSACVPSFSPVSVVDIVMSALSVMREKS